MANMFDQLPPKVKQQWRMNSAKGGRGARGAVKARACKIGWKKSPHRFDKKKEQNLAERERRPARKARNPMPSGFFCLQCGKWHDFPPGFDHRTKQFHRCGCGQEHTIYRGEAKAIDE
jgi:hypothetical protein